MNNEIVENEQRNVIILWNYLNWGGAQIYLLSIVKHAPKNWKFKIVIPRKSPSDIIELFKKNGAEIEFQNVVLDTNQAVSIAQKIKRQWRRIHSEIATYRYIRRQNLENTVLHIETAPWQSWIFIKKLADRVNVFVTMHNSLPAVSNLRRKVWKSRLKYLSKLRRFHIFTSNKDTKNSLKGWVTDDFWERIKVTYTCVDPSEIDEVLKLNISKEQIREKFGVGSQKFVVLSVGQFIDRKGRRDFLKAAKKLIEDGDSFQFLWLTQTDLNAEDLVLIESFELGDSFRLVKSESVGRERLDILQFFLIADTFALPSYVEGLPIALLEAMALGIPSISTNVNAIPEAVKNNQTGLLIEAGNSAELAEAIKKLKDDSTLRQKLSEQGRQFVIKEFDERVCARTVLESYETALKNGN
ncbi:N/A [soil metagenome]